MLLPWSRAAKRRRLLAQPFPEAWEAVLSRLAFFGSLSPEERGRTRDVVRLLLAEKRWEGCAGFDLTDERKVRIAAHAARLVLGLDDEPFRRVTSILVYPSAFVAPVGHVRHGVVEEGAARAGESWDHGAVVLAWDAVAAGTASEEDGHNVVLHEFAHVLDWLDGWADGSPPLLRRGEYDAWTQVFRAEYQALVKDVRRGRYTLLDGYGAENPSEFFAVATETFFEKPVALRARHPALYERMKGFYRQDPAARPPF